VEEDMKRHKKDEVTTNLGLPLELRLRVDEMAISRARRFGRKPHMKELMAEAIELLSAAEART
jgi:hypothetical protein